MSKLLNAITVDVEDYYQVSAFAAAVNRKDWSDKPSHVVANTQRLIDLFAEFEVNGTKAQLSSVRRRFGLRSYSKTPLALQ